MHTKVGNLTLLAVGSLILALAIDGAYGIITVQIGGATRLTSPSRSRYHCYWDCDLVGCQLTRDDDECAYDCEKVCRPRYDYLGRSDSNSAAASSGSPVEKAALPVNDDTELKPKSAATAESVQQPSANAIDNDINLGKLTGSL